MNIHGKNLLEKEKSTKKYNDEVSRKYLKEIRLRYEDWKNKNERLSGPFSKKLKKDTEILGKRTEYFIEYKDFLDQQKYAEKFDSRSNLHSSVIEEFMYFLFRDLVASFSDKALIGKAHTFKDIFFMPSSYSNMVDNPNVKIEEKDHDFVIGTNIESIFKCSGKGKEEKHSFKIPAVAIECKTYLDKTMLEGASTAAEQLKTKNPNSIYIVVSEWLKLTEKINLRKFKVDQIYVLRKQRNTDREYRFLPDYIKNPVYLDVVEHLFNFVREHLTGDWQGGIKYGLKRGYLME